MPETQQETAHAEGKVSSTAARDKGSAPAVNSALRSLILPIYAPHQAMHDISGDGSFNAHELESMPSRTAAVVFDYGIAEFKRAVEGKSIPLKEAVEVFAQLSESKSARILDSMVEFKARNALFVALYHKDPERAVSVLMATKEGPYSDGREGALAYSLLKSMNETDRGALMHAVGDIDPGFVKNIRAQGARFLALAGKGPAVGPIASTDGEPEPSVTRREMSKDDAATPEVFQKEYLISSFDRHPAIQTYGAGPCVVLSLYDPKSKTGALAHFDATTPVPDSVDRILQDFSLRGLDPRDLQARLVGGHQGTSEKLVYEMQRRLSDAKIKVIERDVLSHNEVKAVELNLGTGVLSDFIEAAHNTSDEQFRSKMAAVLQNMRGLIRRHSDSLRSVGVSETVE